MTNTSEVKVSLVVPVYNEASVLLTFVEHVKGVLGTTENSYEVIFVDDGSTDSSWETLTHIASASEHVRAIRFTRNFGKEAAIQAGLQQARGKAVIIMDADLQHPPELLSQMIMLWEKDGYDVVEGVRTARQKEPLSNRIGTIVFYKMLRMSTGFDMRQDTDYKLLDRKVVELYLSLKEKGRFFRALIPFLGFKTARLPFIPGTRDDGQTRFSLIKRFNLAIAAVTSFSSLPLHLVTLLGVITLVFSSVLGAQTIYNKLSGKAVEGFTTVILVILIIGSILMIALGIIGEYIARIFEEVKNRPSFVVGDTLNIEDRDRG